MPGGPVTINAFQAVIERPTAIQDGTPVYIAYSAYPGDPVAGISLTTVTFSASGPYPVYDIQTEGLLTVPGANFIAGQPVYVDQNGYLVSEGNFSTSGNNYVFARVGYALSTEIVDLKIERVIPRWSANVRPIVISAAAPYPHQATNAEMTTLGLTP